MMELKRENLERTRQNLKENTTEKGGKLGFDQKLFLMTHDPAH